MVAEPSEAERPTLAAVAEAWPAVDDPSATAWTHYRAKRYREAMAYFARAALAEPRRWKHPFNLACAATLAGDTAVAQLGLVEAASRDPLATARRARTDADLASLRGEPWFDSVIQGDPLPSPDRNAMAPADLERLRAALRARHRIPPVVRASLTVPQADGSRLAFAIYEISAMDACVLAASRRTCAAKLRGHDDELDRTRCAEVFVVRARSTDPLELDPPIALKLPCRAASLRRFEAVDVDADGALEILADVVDTRRHAGFHEHELAIAMGRDVRILRLDGTEQYGLQLAWDVVEFAGAAERATRFELVDHDGDGHPDLRIDTREFMAFESAVEFDDALWPVSGDEAAVDPVHTRVRLYVPEKDVWGPPGAR